jgi:glutaredoxin 3
MPVPRPFLYLKPGCPWCTEAEDFLKAHGIAYDSVDVYANPEAMAELKRISGQSKAPTMLWGEELLADFGAEELHAFLRVRGVVK